jgi:hypothetical protein
VNRQQCSPQIQSTVSPIDCRPFDKEGGYILDRDVDGNSKPPTAKPELSHAIGQHRM